MKNLYLRVKALSTGLMESAIFTATFQLFSRVRLLYIFFLIIRDGSLLVHSLALNCFSKKKKKEKKEERKNERNLFQSGANALSKMV